MGWLQKVLSARRAGAWVLVAAVLLTLPSATLGLMLDDYSHRVMVERRYPIPGGPRAVWDLFRFQDANRASFRELLDMGVAPW